MKQTAVEWLEEFMTNGKQKSIGIISLACAKAKEMEKQQIIDAYSIGAINGEMIERDLKPKYTNPIQYYNETFKSE
jgi:hypothetical protein